MSQQKLIRKVHHQPQWHESRNHLTHSEEETQLPFQKTPITPSPEPLAPAEGKTVSGPGSMEGKVGTMTAATTEHNRTTSASCSSSCKQRGLLGSHPHPLPPAWEISVCRETIITVIYNQAQAYRGTSEKLQSFWWYVACSWTDVLKE